jgi:2-polyprenyl-6-methoxyphenol hydroxylase-like FAD-dependent oxidoreductase
MNTPQVLIVGAGPTGMTVAIELRRAGMEVRIVDKSNHPALYSQALVVQARTLEQFQRYGLAERAVAEGQILKGIRFWSEGKEIAAIDFKRIPSRYAYLLCLPQSRTEALLNEKMEALGVQAERETELISVAQREGGVSSVLRHADGREETVDSRWVVGCDGAHSTVRKLMGIPFEGGGVGLFFSLGDLELEGPDVPTDELSLHLHEGDLVFMVRLSEKLTRMIVVLHTEQKGEEKRELSIQDFQEAADRAGIRVKVRGSEWMTPFHVNDRQATAYRAGSCFLAGDASHIHSPAGGQGMNTGIQDVANLAWKLAAVARGADEALLDSYHEERSEVGRKLLKFTERGLKMGTANPLMGWVRDAVLPVVTQFDAVRNAMVGFVSETAIEYRSSSIVVDEGGEGSLRAGDRMPDLGLTGGTSLLRDWTEGEHLALLLGATEAEVAEVTGELAHAKVVARREEDFEAEGRKLLGGGKMLLIVRPDGYVGFRGLLEAREAWRAYARQDGLGAEA